METTWVLVADASRARVFKAGGSDSHPHEVTTFLHPAGRANNGDFNTDSNGRLFGEEGQHQGHAAAPRVDPAQHELERFTKSIGDFLNHARATNQYDRLCIVAPPKMLGALRPQLSEAVLSHIDEEIAKDISWFEPAQLERYLSQAFSAKAAL